MIYVVFKLAKNYNCNLSLLITINYLAASVLGLFLFNHSVDYLWQSSKNWYTYGVILGILFIAMFYLIGISSQKAGITVTTLANKLSLVFPVLFSLLYFNEKITTIKTAALLTSFIAMFLTVFKKDIKRTNFIYIILPFVIFFGSGIVDSLIKFVQAVKINSNEASVFSTLVFIISFTIGTITLIFKREKWHFFHYPTLLLGTILGLVNFGSLFFIINALNKSNLNSSMVFTINNMSVVALSAILGTFFFREHLSKINISGILLAILSLYFLL